MAYKISNSCVACGTCIDECPVEAISAGDIYVIDPDKCIDCGTCAGVCPCEAFAPAEFSAGTGKNGECLTGCSPFSLWRGGLMGRGPYGDGSFMETETERRRGLY